MTDEQSTPSDDKPASAQDFRSAFASRWARKLMPADLQKILTTDDLINVVEFLTTQKKKGS